MWSILCFGDSITWGAGETPAAGWVGRLKKHVETDEHRAVYNLGICGDTSADLAKRFRTECDARVRIKRPEDQFLILIAIGINDSLWSSGAHRKRFRITPGRFEQNIMGLIRQARAYPAKVALIGLTPVDESLTTPYEETVISNERIAQFNDILRTCCKRADVPFLDVFSLLSAEKYHSMLDDGLHPNAKGYAFMHAHIEAFLRREKLFPALR